MSTDNIYRSIVKESGEEVLVYKNVFGCYRDLKSTREFKEESLTDFISLSKILGVATNVPKNRAVQVYYGCQHTELEFHSVYIGDIATIEIDENLGFKSVINGTQRVFHKHYGMFTDLETYETYSDNSMEIGDNIVVNTTLINDYFHNELPGSRQSRQKIMTFCNKKFSNIR